MANMNNELTIFYNDDQLEQLNIAAERNHQAVEQYILERSVQCATIENIVEREAVEIDKHE